MGAAHDLLRNGLAASSLQRIGDEGAESQMQEACRKFTQQWEQASETQAVVYSRQRLFCALRGKLRLSVLLAIVLLAGTVAWPSWDLAWLVMGSILLAAQFVALIILNRIGSAIKREHSKSEYLSKDAP